MMRNPYTKTIYYFVSDYIANLYFNKLNEHKNKKLIKFIENTKDIKELKGLLEQILN